MITTNLTPPTVAAADYEVAQNPALGGEREAYLSSGAALVLGYASVTDDVGTVEYEYINTPVQGGTQAPIVAFVVNELKADSDVLVHYGDLSATFTAAGWSSDQSSNFGATRGVELTGSGVQSITSATEPNITNAKRGAKIGFLQLPLWNTFVRIGSATAGDVTPPVRTSKNISSGMWTNRYNKPGRYAEARLKVAGKDLGPDDGLNRFRGQVTVACLATNKEETVVTDKQFFTRYVVAQNITNPDSDGECELVSESSFQNMVTLVAP